MNTEIADNPAIVAGFIFCDADCRFCSAGHRRWGHDFERRSFAGLPIHTPGITKRLGVTLEKLKAEMWGMPIASQKPMGVDAWIHLMHQVWWLKPLGAVVGLPGTRNLTQVADRRITRNGNCIDRHCHLRQSKQEKRHSAFFEMP